jgi:hypothetical protein
LQLSGTSADDHDPAAGPQQPVRVQRVSPPSANDRRLVSAGVAVVIALAAFLVGRQSVAPTPAPPPSASATVVPTASPPTLMAIPWAQMAIIAGELEAAARPLLDSGNWAVCQAGGTVSCQPASPMILTPAEAQTARTAWPRLQPTRIPLGETIVVAPATAISYALYVSLDLQTAPTILDPAVWPAGFILDLGPFLPAGRYVVMIAGEPHQPTPARFEAIGLQTGP